VVIAAGPGLGTINHTLLTIDSVRAAGLDVTAVVLTPWPPTPEPIHESNRETIGAVASVRVDVLPEIDLATPARWPALRV
jgi:dethiobiotin synthetase